MSANRSNLNNGNNDLFMVTLCILILIVLLLVVIWFNFHSYIVLFSIKIAYTLLPLIEITSSWSLKFYVHEIYQDVFVPSNIISELESYRYWLPRTDPTTINFDTFVSFLNLSGYSLRIITPFITALCIIYVWRRSKAARLNESHDIFSLAKIAMEQFPQIRPPIIQNLLNEHPDIGFFRREISPIRFAIYNELIKAYTTDFKGNLLDTLVTPTFDKSKSEKVGIEYIKDDLSRGIAKLHNRCILDRKKTEQVFAAQLGNLWTNSTDLNPFTKAIYSALITFVSGNKDESFALLEQFNRSWQPPKNHKKAKIDISGINEIIIKYETLPEIEEVISSHAYVNTVMPRLLELARSKGRLGTAMFSWLKVVDRELWYSLNQEGGQCGWSEAAGPRAHKIAECSVKGPLNKPFVDTAVDAFEDYLQTEEGWIPLPEHCPKPMKKDKKYVN